MPQLHPSSRQPDLTGLMTAVRKNKSCDSRRLNALTWRALQEVLVPQVTEYHETLIRQGENDRNLYFLESGLLRVYRSDKGARLQLAVLGPGSVVGEGTFFSPIVRNASVEAIEASLVWELTPERFETMLTKYPEAALMLTLYLGGVLSGRMLSVAGRLSIT